MKLRPRGETCDENEKLDKEGSGKWEAERSDAIRGKELNFWGEDEGRREKYRVRK